MNKKSKRKNNLKSSIILLLLLILLLISSTYAWFTANETVTISSIDVTIDAANGLQISTNATAWKALIGVDDINSGYTDHNNSIPQRMVPVSTIGEIDGNTGYMKMFKGNVAADAATGMDELTAAVSAEGADITEEFVAFDIFLKVDAQTQLKLTKDSGVIKNGENDKGIKQASRIAFVTQGTAEAGADPDDIVALTAGADAPVYIWEPNSNLHTAAALAHASNNYGITGITVDANGVGTGSVDYYGIKAAIDDGIELAKTNNSTASGDYFTKVEPTYITESDKDGVMTAEENIFTLDAGITKMRVYMWIEGQDIDCENTASGTNISYKLQFSVVK